MLFFPSIQSAIRSLCLRFAVIADQRQLVVVFSRKRVWIPLEQVKCTLLCIRISHAQAAQALKQWLFVKAGSPILCG